MLTCTSPRKGIPLDRVWFGQGKDPELFIPQYLDGRHFAGFWAFSACPQGAYI